ncbi:helix-turn-helix transcriptional regulator [Haloarcula sp. AONF1]
MSGSIAPPLLETVARRASVIKRLLENRADKRELEADLDVSRTTIDRAIRRLTDADCIVCQDGKWEVTLLGQFAYEEYEQLATGYRSLIVAQPLLDHLSPTTPVDMRVITDADVLLAEPPAPHEPVTKLEDLLQYCERVKGLSSVVLPRYVSLFHHHIVDCGTDTNLIFGSELVGYLWTNHRDEMEMILKTDNAKVWETDQKPSFGVVLIDEEVVWFAVYGSNGGLKGTIINDSDSAISWAIEVLQSYRQQSKMISLQDIFCNND